MADRNIVSLLEKIREDESISDSQEKSLKKFEKELDVDERSKFLHLNSLYQLVKRLFDEEVELEYPETRHIQIIQDRLEQEQLSPYTKYSSINSWNLFLSTVNSDRRIEVNQTFELELGEFDG